MRSSGFGLTRRTLLAGAAAGAPAPVACALVLRTPSSASTSPRATSSRSRSRFRISSAAAPNDSEVARNVTQVITANLKRSGLFAPIDPAAYIEKVSNIDALPRFRRLARPSTPRRSSPAASPARATGG